MLVVALFQSVGRLGVLVLDDLELAANQWLSAQQIRVSGLEGSWRLLNPVVMIDRIDLPAGHLADVVVELDWIESLIRNRFVARQLIVRDAQVLVERRDGKWQLAGAGAGAEFDFSGLLYQGDELSLNGSVALRREDEQASAPIRVSYSAVNRGGTHRMHAFFCCSLQQGARDFGIITGEIGGIQNTLQALAGTVIFQPIQN